MKAHDIFFGADDRLRSGWRFAVFVALYIFALVFVGMIVGSLAYSFFLPPPSLFLFSSIATLIPALVLGWLCGKYLEGLPFRALGASPTAGWLRHFVLGSILGAGTLAFGVFLAALFGDLDFVWSNSSSTGITRSMLFSVLLFGAAAAFEEVLFRGYILQTFARSGLAWFAILLTSLFFGLVHLNNPNANCLAAINTALAGVWFGIAYLKTRDLWFVWGLHLFWNWMQGSFFGIEVSGLTEIVGATFLKEVDNGPAWLTGGNYGIEAGIACTFALIASTIGIHFLPLKVEEEMYVLTSPKQLEERTTT